MTGFLPTHSNMMVQGQLFPFMPRKVGSKKLIQKFTLKELLTLNISCGTNSSVSISLASSGQYHFVWQVIHFYILNFLLGADQSIKLGSRAL